MRCKLVQFAARKTAQMINKMHPKSGTINEIYSTPNSVTNIYYNQRNILLLCSVVTNNFIITGRNFGV